MLLMDLPVPAVWIVLVVGFVLGAMNHVVLAASLLGVGVFGIILGGFTLGYLAASARRHPGVLSPLEQTIGRWLAGLNLIPVGLGGMIILVGLAVEIYHLHSR
ncbi:MAG TPA: hypothetical protein VL371_06975 [Gemmataceae bacterium]|nr:hypothetical protein [Gemmataceae bacterium]